MDGDSVNQGEALAAFVDQLGATLSVMINRSTSYSSTRRFVAQAMANDVGVQDSAGRMIVPYEFPTYQGKPTVASLCIVWDRPTSPTSGHRVFLRRALAGLGMDPSQVANVWAYPFALTSPPLENQCLTYLEATHEAIRASGAHYVVLLGTTAIHLWRRELQLNQVIGKIGVWKGTWFVYPMPNPIVPISDQLLMPQYREYVRTIVDIVQSDTGMDELAHQCVEKDCQKDDAIDSRVFVYDPDGLPWCKTHWRKGFKRRLDHLRKFTTKLNETLQDGMP